MRVNERFLSYLNRLSKRGSEITCIKRSCKINFYEAPTSLPPRKKNTQSDLLSQIKPDKGLQACEHLQVTELRFRFIAGTDILTWPLKHGSAKMLR